MVLQKKLSTCPINTVFDVGANVGNWCDLAAGYFPAARIHAFEISAGTFRTLAARLGNDARFTLNNFGLSNRAGNIHYRDFGDGSGHNSIIVENVGGHGSIESVPLSEARVDTGDDYCSRNSISQIDFLKLDVEGAEHLILEGFTRMLAAQAIGLVQFEYGYINGATKFLMKDFFDFFSSHDYVVGRLTPEPIEFRAFQSKDNDFKSGPNYIAVASGNTELIDLLVR